jgi:hypothetical protein
MMLRLPHDSTDERERYGMAAPDHEAHTRAYRAVWYGEGEVTREDLVSLLTMADSYLDLIDNPARRGMRKIRDMRRALRDREPPPSRERE